MADTVDHRADYAGDILDRRMVAEADNLDIHQIGLVGLDKAEFELVEVGQDGRVHSWQQLEAHYQTLKIFNSTQVSTCNITCAHDFGKTF